MDEMLESKFLAAEKNCSFFCNTSSPKESYKLYNNKSERLINSFVSIYTEIQKLVHFS